MADNSEIPDFDAVDGLSLVAIFIATAVSVSSGGSLIIALPLLLGYLAQHKGRRTDAFQNLVSDKSGKLLPITKALLPAPRDTSSIAINNTNYGNQTINNTEEPLWKRITNPTIGAETTVIERISADNNAATQKAALLKGIKRLPRYISYNQLENPPSAFSVPIGFDSDASKIVWADFTENTIHAIIAGYTGSGKDALLRLWFTLLTAGNTPDDVQFVIIDGKVDWLSPALADSAYMAIPPAGGTDIQKVDGKYKDCAIDAMKENLDWLFNEIQRRQRLFSRVGAVDMKSYARRTGKKLPIIFFIASDVGETFDNDLNMFVNLLAMKGRAYGIRMIISMQNPVGEKTKWKSQIGLIMTGHQPNPDHDRYILGINIPVMRFRPSHLPNPEENDISRGLFIVRRGSTQMLVRTPHLPEEDWEMYIEQDMRRKSAANDDLLASLMSSKVEHKETRPLEIPKQVIPVQQIKVTLPKETVQKVARLAASGASKTEIMAELKVTNGNKYKEVSPIVDKIIEKVHELQTH